MTEELRNRRIRRAAVLIVLGLVIGAATLTWAHPTAFLVFLLAGGTTMAAGILFYLHATIS